VTPYFDRDGITIYHARCEDVLPTIDPDEIGVLVMDPPYGIEYRSNWPKTVASYRQEIDGDETTQLRDEVLAWWGERPALVFGSWKVPRPPRTRQVLTWDKGEAAGMGDLSIPWKPNTEEVYVLGSGFSGHRSSSILRGHVVTWASKGRGHPHQKPVSVMHSLVSKAPDGTVLDPFMGSGPVAAACQSLGRRYIGIELVEDYCAIAVSRLSQQTLDLTGGAA
jgi:DNA modification methylase